MKKVFTIIITTVIIVVVIMFLLIMILLGNLFIKNPFGIGDLIKSQFFNLDKGVIDSNYDHPLLSDEQEKQLIEAGIDPAKIPTEITPELKECITSKISEERVQEIINGTEPTLFEVIKVLPCL